MRSPAEWLKSTGREWRDAAFEAAAEILLNHRRRWPDLVPIELHRLAWSLGVRIVRVPDLTGEACIIPAKGGFQVLVTTSLRQARFRLSVAHELAHTLFYDRDSDPPRRLFPTSDREEHFCFDVARRVLAPEWLIERSGIRNMTDGEEAFRLLVDPTGPFRLARPVAARVMLDDYRLARGIGGRCVLEDGQWSRQCAAAASPRLNRDERASLWRIALTWLAQKRTPVGYRVFSLVETSSTATFVVVLRLF
jgi:hypothetical protein